MQNYTQQQTNLDLVNFLQDPEQEPYLADLMKKTHL